MTADAESGAGAGAPAPALLDVRDLSVHYDVGHRRPPTRALDGVSLALGARETVGLVGESGSGKSTVGRAILGLTPATSGSVFFDGNDITRAGYRERQRLSAEMQVVFQDPYSSLNPTRSVGQTLRETMRGQGQRRGSRAVDDRVSLMLSRVGLPLSAAERYPAHFSGGQRQRIAIARALMVQPRLVVCDEPVSALDLSVQAQVLNLLGDLQREFDLSYLFIAHDLAVVRHLSHRIVVLYRGRIMEEGPAERVYTQPVHPYTQMLLQAAPVPDPALQRRRRANRASTEPGGASPTSGDACLFAPRCPHARDFCRTSRPVLEEAGERVLVACHRWRELTPDADVPRLSARTARVDVQDRAD